MGRGLLIILLLLLGVTAKTQVFYTKIDKKAKEVPDTLNTIPEIVDYLCEGVQNDRKKLRAFYVYLAEHIHYDYALLEGDVYQNSEEMIYTLMTEKRGVCQHYAEAFQAMCNRIGVKSYVVSGYTYDDRGRLMDVGHSWNAVYINGEYRLIDACWASGYTRAGRIRHKFNDKYFLKTPEQFIKTHIPYDPLFQFLTYPLTHYDVKIHDYANLNLVGDFNIKDSLAVYDRLPRLDQLSSSLRRIKQCGLENDNTLHYCLLIYEQINYCNYNLALNKLNACIDEYNKYVEHKQNGFRRPCLSLDDINRLLGGCKEDLLDVQNDLNAILSKTRKMESLVLLTKTRTSKILGLIEAELDFIAKL